MSKLAVPILASASQQQDNPVTMIRPVDTTLDSNGLAPIDTSFFQGDQLLRFDNTQEQIGKQPNKIYTFNDGWRLSSDNLDHSKDIVPAGSAMLVRRAAKQLPNSLLGKCPDLRAGNVPLSAGRRLKQEPWGPETSILTCLR